MGIFFLGWVGALLVISDGEPVPIRIAGAVLLALAVVLWLAAEALQHRFDAKTEQRRLEHDEANDE